MKKVATIAVFVLIMSMAIPAYAEVTSLKLAKPTYTNEESFVFTGFEQEGNKSVFVIIRDLSGDYKGMASDPSSGEDGEFFTIGRTVEDFFSSKGIYNATAFLDDQQENEGFTIKIEYDGKKIFVVPDFELALKPISDKTIEEEKTLSFTASITDSSLDGVKYSLEKNPPSGAVINENTGKFTWTPTKSQGNQQGLIYEFDIVVKKSSQEDRETIRITVTEPAPTPQPKDEPEPEPEPEPKDESTELEIPAAFVDEAKDPQYYVDRYLNEASYKKWFDDNYSEYESIYQAVGLEKQLEIPAAFVDEAKDPQYYVDRYLNEASYKKWFDDNYSEYESIYQAVGLEAPKELAAFVDPNLDPQYYVDRYLNEPNYKKWFDDNFPDMTIYDAVGLDEPEVKEPEIGECGPGTALIDGVCEIVEKENTGGGGCLIATAAYGSEMAPQVQFLREIRDGKVMSTSSGAAFMTGFNQFYYSFSPTIADYERENPVFKEMVKLGITPMLATLSVMSNAESEQEILGYGIAVIMMNAGIYFAAPAMAFFGFKKLRKSTKF